jgi:hypothetical protein
MNIFTKVTVAALLSGLTLGSAAAARAEGLGFSIALPSLGAVTAEVSKVIAADLTAYLRNAVQAPRASRTRQSPSVSIYEMETVVVVATRLPPSDQLVEQEVTRTAQVRSQVTL